MRVVEQNMKTTPNTQTAIAISLTAAIMACAGTVRGDEQNLQNKIKKLEQRISELEDKGPAVAAEKGKPWDAWLGTTKFSGYVSSSYMYSFNRSKEVSGRYFDNDHNEFNVNKFKLVLSDRWTIAAPNGTRGTGGPRHRGRCQNDRSTKWANYWGCNGLRADLRNR